MGKIIMVKIQEKFGRFWAMGFMKGLVIIMEKDMELEN
jgi:hypothetical protein